ncbi:MAG: DUF5063 domain-containing protein [Bacteroidales bacterium]|jgi:hypothetical protein|nr:DUF5063 domain-containing protein [Bacteroidales bacterium]
MPAESSVGLSSVHTRANICETPHYSKPPTVRHNIMTTQQLSTDLKEILEKETTQTFLKSARQFIEIVENDKIDKEKFYNIAHTTLIDLYAAGHKLEIIDLKYSSSDSNFEDPSDNIFKAKNIELMSSLGQDCFYWEVFDPTYNKENKPTQGWLVDDFSDIYRDLKTELNKIDNITTDEAVEDALWQLRFGFYHHWGNHCINAIRALHYLWYDGKQAM